jgi:hypothetical protein
MTFLSQNMMSRAVCAFNNNRVSIENGVENCRGADNGVTAGGPLISPENHPES